jgi:hypothetical protein
MHTILNEDHRTVSENTHSFFLKKLNVCTMEINDRFALGNVYHDMWNLRDQKFYDIFLLHRPLGIPEVDSGSWEG